jgi:hypothetical protein
MCSPSRATWRNVSSELAAMRMGGCGDWYGTGETATLFTWKNSPA